MDIEEKIKVINSIVVVDSSSSCGECEYILINDTEDNRDILKRLEMTNDDIDDYADGGYIDISEIAFKFADIYNPQEGFYLEKIQN